MKLKKSVKRFILFIVFLLVIILCFVIINNEDNNINNMETFKEDESTKNITNLTEIVSSTSSTKSSLKENKTTTSTKEKTTSTKKNSTSNKVVYKNGAYYIDDILIVNKSYPLSESWKPVDSQKEIPEDGFDRGLLDRTANDKFSEMISDASSLGLNIWAQSGYRDYYYQKDLYDNYVKRSGKDAADKYSARPGHSEHQSGLAVDLNTIDDSFADTQEGKWINENCYLYGFIIRYPKGKEPFTGYIYEPWHIRYVGVDLAKNLYNDGDWLSIEEYYKIDSKYN